QRETRPDARARAEAIPLGSEYSVGCPAFLPRDQSTFHAVGMLSARNEPARRRLGHPLSAIGTPQVRALHGAGHSANLLPPLPACEECRLRFRAPAWRRRGPIRVSGPRLADRIQSANRSAAPKERWRLPLQSRPR